MCYACGFPSLSHAKTSPDAAATMPEITASPDDLATVNVLALGDTFEGTLDRIGDRDWIRLDLSEGQSVVITMDGDTLADPFLRLMDMTGRQIAFNDDFSGLNARIDFVAETGGPYFIVADSYLSGGIGSYEIEVTLAHAPLPNDPDGLLRAIDWQAPLQPGEVTYMLAPAGYQEDGLTADPMTAYEAQQLRAAFDILERYIDVEFREVTSPSADFRLMIDTNELSAGLRGFMYPSDLPNAGLGAFNAAAWDRGPGGDLEIGGEAFMVVVHELLHGLGLAHPHDTGGSSDVMHGVSTAWGDLGTFDLNQGVYTTMSYNGGYHGNGSAARANTDLHGFQASPMALDIAVLQHHYGANATHAAGDDVYLLPEQNARGTAWEAIWDTGGTDAILYLGAGDAHIDLRPATLRSEVGGGGFLSNVAGVAGGYTIANGVTLENAQSGRGNDVVTGNDANNALDAGIGADLLTGLGGADTLFGGRGNDTLLGGEGDDLIHGDAGRDSLLGGEGNDTLIAGDGNDRLSGGAGADHLSAASGRNLLQGDAGDDTLTGGADNDRLKGGDDDDSLDGGAGADRLRGNTGADRLIGGAGADHLSGGGDNDTLAGDGGNDTLTGGGGRDVFWFSLGDGVDHITDFRANRDALSLDHALWGSITTAAALIDHRAIRAGDDLIFDFGDGDRLIVTLTQTADDIDIFSH